MSSEVYSLVMSMIFNLNTSQYPRSSSKKASIVLDLPLARKFAMAILLGLSLTTIIRFPAQAEYEHNPSINANNVAINNAGRIGVLMKNGSILRLYLCDDSRFGYCWEWDLVSASITGPGMPLNRVKRGWGAIAYYNDLDYAFIDVIDDPRCIRHLYRDGEHRNSDICYNFFPD